MTYPKTSLSALLLMTAAIGPDAQAGKPAPRPSLATAAAVQISSTVEQPQPAASAPHASQRDQRGVLREQQRMHRALRDAALPAVTISR